MEHKDIVHLFETYANDVFRLALLLPLQRIINLQVTMCKLIIKMDSVQFTCTWIHIVFLPGKLSAKGSRLVQ